MSQRIHQRFGIIAHHYWAKKISKSSLYCSLHSFLHLRWSSQVVCILIHLFYIISDISCHTFLIIHTLCHIVYIRWSNIIVSDGASIDFLFGVRRYSRAIQFQYRLFFLQQLIQLHFCLFKLKLIGEFGMPLWLLDHLLCVQINLTHKFSCWVTGPILVLEKFFLHAFRVGLCLDLFVTSKDPFF